MTDFRVPVPMDLSPAGLPPGWSFFAAEAMASAWFMRLYGDDADYLGGAAREAWTELERLEQALSRFLPGSDVSRINRAEPGSPVIVGPAVLECLELSEALGRETGGAFDITYATPGARRSGPGYRLGGPAGPVFIERPGLQLDLGAIGKGYALDRLAEILMTWDISAGLLGAGGSTVLAFGEAPEAAGWPLGVGDGARSGVVRLRSGAFSGSGTAVRGEHIRRSSAQQGEIDGLAPRQAWACAPMAAVADALSTAFFNMSRSAWVGFCETTPRVAGIRHEASGEIAVTGALDLLGRDEWAYGPFVEPGKFLSDSYSKSLNHG